jgi:hypothetical protein
VNVGGALVQVSDRELIGVTHHPHRNLLVTFGSVSTPSPCRSNQLRTILNGLGLVRGAGSDEGILKLWRP